MYCLYYAPDNASLIIRLALEELGLPYETRLVDRRNAEQRSDAYRELNPNGLIPLCIIDGEPVFETGAILLTLGQRHPGITPATDSADYPHCLKWLFTLSNGLHTDLRQLFYPDLYVGEDPASQRAYRELGRQRIVDRLALFEQLYQRRPGPWLYGERPSAIALYLACCLRWMQLYPVEEAGMIDVHAFPSLMHMLSELERRPAIQRACQQEGIAMPAFTSASYAQPPEGSAT